MSEIILVYRTEWKSYKESFKTLSPRMWVAYSDVGLCGFGATREDAEKMALERTKASNNRGVINPIHAERLAKLIAKLGDQNGR